MCIRDSCWLIANSTCALGASADKAFSLSMLYIILEKQASGVEVERGENNHKGEALRGPAARSAPPPPNPYEPAYMRIVRTVSSRIAHGDYREGDQLPSESQFCTEFDVSPMTLRRAVNMLVDRGLVSTVQSPKCWR